MILTEEVIFDLIWPRKWGIVKPSGNGPNIVGCYMLRPFAHPISCCCVLLEVVAQRIETGQTLSYVQMDATTPNNFGSCLCLHVTLGY